MTMDNVKNIQVLRSIPSKSCSFIENMQSTIYSHTNSKTKQTMQQHMQHMWVELHASPHAPHVSYASHVPLVTFKLSFSSNDHVEVLYVKERGPIKVVADRVKSGLVDRIVARYLGPGVEKREIVYVLVCTATNLRVGELHLNSSMWRLRMRSGPGYRWVTSEGNDASSAPDGSDDGRNDDIIDADVLSFLQCIGLSDIDKNKKKEKARTSPSRLRIKLVPPDKMLNKESYACTGTTMSSAELERCSFTDQAKACII